MQGYKRVIKVIQSLPVLYEFYYTLVTLKTGYKLRYRYSMRPSVLCNIQATRPQGFALI